MPAAEGAQALLHQSWDQTFELEARLAAARRRAHDDLSPDDRGRLVCGQIAGLAGLAGALLEQVLDGKTPEEQAAITRFVSEMGDAFQGMAAERLQRQTLVLPTPRG